MPKIDTEDQNKRVVEIRMHLPEELHTYLRNMAEERGMETTELIRRFIKLGFTVIEMENAGEALCVYDTDEGEYVPIKW